MELETVQRAVGRGAAPGARVAPPSTVDSPQRTVEREALKLAIQAPVLAGPMFDSIGPEAYQHPLHVAVRAAIAEAGGAAGAVAGASRAGGRRAVMALFNRPRLPAERRPPLAPEERILAWSDSDGGLLVATNLGLWAPGFLGWHEIHKAAWDGTDLVVTAAR